MMGSMPGGRTYRGTGLIYLDYDILRRLRDEESRGSLAATITGFFTPLHFVQNDMWGAGWWLEALVAKTNTLFIGEIPKRFCYNLM